MEREITILPTTTIFINGKDYKVAIAETQEEKEKGLSEITEIGPNEGMLFVYDEPSNEMWFTMEDTAVDLDIIFIDEEGEVVKVVPSKAYSEEPVECQIPFQYVLEVKINSGIKKGDELDEFDTEDEEFTDEDRQQASKSRMLVLDENGDVLMKLEGGERIFSRISTRKIIKQALKAYRDETDADFIKLGKMVFKELDALDNRSPEYVKLPNK